MLIDDCQMIEMPPSSPQDTRHDHHSHDSLYYSQSTNNHQSLPASPIPFQKSKQRANPIFKAHSQSQPKIQKDLVLVEQRQQPSPGFTKNITNQQRETIRTNDKSRKRDHVELEVRQLRMQVLNLKESLKSEILNSQKLRIKLDLQQQRQTKRRVQSCEHSCSDAKSGDNYQTKRKVRDESDDETILLKRVQQLEQQKMHLSNYIQSMQNQSSLTQPSFQTSNNHQLSYHNPTTITSISKPKTMSIQLQHCYMIISSNAQINGLIASKQKMQQRLISLEQETQHYRQNVGQLRQEFMDKQCQYQKQIVVMAQKIDQKDVRISYLQQLLDQAQKSQIFKQKQQQHPSREHSTSNSKSRSFIKITQVDMIQDSSQPFSTSHNQSCSPQHLTFHPNDYPRQPRDCINNYELIFRQQQIRSREERVREQEMMFRMEREKCQTNEYEEGRKKDMQMIGKMQNQLESYRREFKGKLQEMARLHAFNLKLQQDLEYYKTNLKQCLIEHSSNKHPSCPVLRDISILSLH